MAPDVLTPFKKSLRSYSARALRRRGVELKLEAAVAEVTPDEVRLQDGTVIPTRTVIWATGVTAHPVVSTWGLPQGRGGRIVIGPDMRVKGFDDVFAIGDVGGDPDNLLPQVAQPAIQQGIHVAETISRLLVDMGSTRFHYTDKGIMATIGRRAAVGQLPFKIALRGTLAWLAWVGLHVFFLLSNRNRFAVLTNLAVRYLAGRATPTSSSATGSRSGPRRCSRSASTRCVRTSTRPSSSGPSARSSEEPQPLSKR